MPCRTIRRWLPIPFGKELLHATCPVLRVSPTKMIPLFLCVELSIHPYTQLKLSLNNSQKPKFYVMFLSFSTTYVCDYNSMYNRTFLEVRKEPGMLSITDTNSGERSRLKMKR